MTTVAKEAHAVEATDQTILDALQTRGCAVLPDLIDKATVAMIREELAPFLQRKHMGRNDFEGFSSERVYALLAKAPTVASIIEHPRILGLVDQLLPKN